MGLDLMLAVPTTTVSVLRGTTVDVYLDTVDNSTVAASGVPASLLEQSQNTTRPADRRQQTTRMARCRVPAATDVRPGDRILDERTGTIWALDDTAQIRNIVTTTDKRLRLRLPT